MSSAGAIRAGRAFVEMYIDDATVKASIDNVKARLKTFGAAVDAAGSASFARMSAVATSSTAATTASVGILAATMGVLRASVYAVGNAFRVVFNTATASVTRAVIGIGGMAIALNRFMPGSKLTGFLNQFLTKSQTTEAVGRWTRFLGFLTGSSVMKSFGNRIERLGLGASIVRGFQSGGVMGGIGASIGAGIRSSRSVIFGALGSVLTSPFRAAGMLLHRGGGSASSIGATAGGGSNGAPAIASGMDAASRSTMTLANSFGALRSVGAIFTGLAVKVGGFAAAITGPALLAAKSFVTAASDMISKAKETGESLQSLIAEKYGNMGIITPEDIQAAGALSDAMKTMKQAVAAAWAQIGAAALPVLRGIVEQTTTMATAIGLFLSQNREIITTVVTVAAKIGGIAAAIGALGAAFTMASTVMPLILNPLTLIGVGVAALVYFFPQVRQAAMTAFEFLFGSFQSLSSIVTTSMQGMADAIAGGNLMLAGRILWTGLYALWLQGTDRIRGTYDAMVTGIAATFIKLWAGLRSAWSITMGFFYDAWVGVTRRIVDTWTGVQDTISREFAAMIALFTGQNVNDVLRTFDEDKKRKDRQKDTARNAADKKTEDARNAADKSIEEQMRGALGANQEADAAKSQARRDELARVTAELDALNQQAADAKKKRAGATGGQSGAAVLAGVQGSETLGTFSAASINRQQIGGIKELKNIDKNIQIIADNSDKGLKVGA